MNKIAVKLTERVNEFMASLHCGAGRHFNLSIDGMGEQELHEVDAWEALSRKQDDAAVEIVADDYRQRTNITPAKSTLENYIGTTIDIHQLTKDALERKQH